MEETFILQEEMLLNLGLDEDIIETQMEKAREDTSPFQSAISGAVGMGLIGLVLSLIMSIFLKKTDDPFNEAMQELKE